MKTLWQSPTQVIFLFCFLSWYLINHFAPSIFYLSLILSLSLVNVGVGAHHIYNLCKATNNCIRNLLIVVILFLLCKFHFYQTLRVRCTAVAPHHRAKVSPHLPPWTLHYRWVLDTVLINASPRRWGQGWYVCVDIYFLLYFLCDSIKHTEGREAVVPCKPRKNGQVGLARSWSVLWICRREKWGKSSLFTIFTEFLEVLWGLPYYCFFWVGVALHWACSLSCFRALHVVSAILMFLSLAFRPVITARVSDNSCCALPIMCEKIM